MKFQITFKDPDGVYDSLVDDAGLDFNELPDDVEEVVSKFIEFKEYITIEFDSETGTATVIPN